MRTPPYITILYSLTRVLANVDQAEVFHVGNAPDAYLIKRPVALERTTELVAGFWYHLSGTLHTNYILPTWSGPM